MRFLTSLLIGTAMLFPGVRERNAQRQYVPAAEACDTEAIKTPVAPTAKPTAPATAPKVTMKKIQVKVCDGKSCHLEDRWVPVTQGPVKSAVKAVANKTCGCNCPNCPCGEKWVSQPAAQQPCVRRGLFGWRRR